MKNFNETWESKWRFMLSEICEWDQVKAAQWLENLDHEASDTYTRSYLTHYSSCWAVAIRILCPLVRYENVLRSKYFENTAERILLEMLFRRQNDPGAPVADLKRKLDFLLTEAGTNFSNVKNATV